VKSNSTIFGLNNYAVKIFKYSILVFALSLVVLSCKKEAVEIVDPIVQSNVSEQGSNDESARDEYDRSVDDVFFALEKTSFGSRSTDSTVILPCGVIRIDTTGGVYKIVYGKNCGKRVLSGSISATLIASNKKWQDTGAVVRLDYSNYTVKFDANGQTLIFNGSLFVTNVNGGLIYETVLFGKTIVHGVRGNIKVTFDNGKTRDWHVYKKRTYSTPTKKTADITLELSADSAGNIAEIGTNKAGDQFITTIPVPYVMENCNTSGTFTGPFVMTRGKLTYTVGPNSLTAEPGYALVSGVITPRNDCNSTGYKLTWNITGITTEKFQYY